MFWIGVLRKRPIFVFQAHTWTHWRHLQGHQMSRRRSERRWMTAIVTWRIYFFFDLRRHWQLLLFQLMQCSNDWEPAYQDRWSPTPDIYHLSMESRSCHLGRFWSLIFLVSDLGSSREGISADISARLIISLTAQWREKRPADFLQLSPWWPSESTCWPHMHVWGRHTGAPMRNAMAIRSEELSRRVPREAHGRASLGSSEVKLPQ